MQYTEDQKKAIEARHRNILVAAAAELTQRTVLHLDKDFDLIADLTGQHASGFGMLTDQFGVTWSASVTEV